MKYKLLKDTPWIANGSIIELVDGDMSIDNDRFVVYNNWKYSSETYDWITWLTENHKEDFEEIKETPKPRWKVGDNVVIEIAWWDTRYGKIEWIMWVNYKSCGWENWMEDKFRDPTQEELDTYFR